MLPHRNMQKYSLTGLSGSQRIFLHIPMGDDVLHIPMGDDFLSF